MKHFVIYFLLIFGNILIFSNFTFSQNVGINTNTPHASAALEVSATDKGMLVPRLTQTQRDNIGSPATGLLIYQNDGISGFYYYNGTTWQLLSGSTIPNKVQDADANTKIETEKTANDDKIHFSLGGTEYFQMSKGTLETQNTGNSTYLGEKVALNDTYSNPTENVGIGWKALEPSTASFENVAVGSRALWSMIDGNNNVAIGKDALRSNNNAYNVAVGSHAGASNQTGLGNVFLGNAAGQNEMGDNKLYIDNSNTSSPLIYGDFSSNLLKINGTLNINNAYSLPTTAGTNGYILRTDGNGTTSWTNPSSLETDPKVGSLSTNYMPKWNGTTLANGQIFDNGTNIGIGTNVPASKLHIVGNQTIETGRISFNSTNSCIFIGQNAGLNFNNTGLVFIGYEAGKSNTTGNRNTFVGYQAGRNTTSGEWNTALGYSSLFSTTTGSFNTALGQSALFANTTGSRNIGIGVNALILNTTGENNVVIGTDAMGSATNASNNVAIGKDAGRNNVAGQGNVFLGNEAGKDETGSNKLYISNNSTASPLIYGDFSDNLLRVNGKMTIGVAYVGSTPPLNGLSVQGDLNIGLPAAYTNLTGRKFFVYDSGQYVSQFHGEHNLGTWFRMSNQFQYWDMVTTGTANSEGAGHLLFRDNNAVRLMMKKGGNIGINTTTPQEKLHIVGNEKLEGELKVSKNAYFAELVGINSDSLHSLGGDLNYSRMEMISNTSDSSDLNVVLYEDGSSSPWLNTAHARGAKASPTVLQAGDDVLGLYGHGYDGADFRRIGGISLAIADTASANNLPTRMTFYTSDSGSASVSARMVINEAGNVGIGQPNPQEKLDVFGNARIWGTLNVSDAYILPTDAGTNGYILQTDGSGAASWVNPNGLVSIAETDPKVGTLTDNYLPRWNTTSLMNSNIYDNGTKVSIGTTSSNVGGNFSFGKFTVASSNNVACDMNVVLADNSPIAPWINAGKARGTLSSFSSVQINDELFNITANGYAVNTFRSGAEIGFRVDASPGINGVPARITFSTTASGQIIPVERMRITSGGNVGIGTTNPSTKLEISGTTKTTNFQMTNGATNNYILKSDASGNASWVNITSLTPAETDPQVGSLSNSYVPKWNGATLTDGQIFDNGTSIGIGNTSPTSKLHIVGSSTDILGVEGSNTTGTWLHLENTSTNGIDWRLVSTGSANSEGAGNFLLQHSGVVRMIVKSSNGAVGIGALNPTQAKLVVNGSQSNTLSYGYLNSGGNTGSISNFTNNYSIYASDRIAASEFNAFSDARIKKVKGISNNEADLHTLLKLKITDYSLIDTIAKGNGAYKKVIAQEVKAVYPQAVKMVTDCIPDIYQLTKVENGIISFSSQTLREGDKVKLIMAESQDIYEVVSVSDKGFKVNKEIKDGAVFIYGHEVNDFHTVDYEALSTLNISATQALFQKIQELSTENVQMKQQNAAFKADFESLKVQVQALQKSR